MVVESIGNTFGKLNVGAPASPAAYNSPVTLVTESNGVPIAPLVSEPTTSPTSSAAASVDTPGRESFSIEDRVKKAKILAMQRQSEREQAEKDEEKNEEVERRKLGKELDELRSRQEEQQLKEAAINRKKDEEEKNKAREAEKAAIEQDRLARKMKYDDDKKEADDKRKEIERKLQKVEAAIQQERLARKMKCDSEKKEAEDKRNATVKITASARASVARLQFRLPDGRTQSKQFPADTSLAEVYTFVESEVVEPTFGKFTLMTTFPRRQLDQEEDQTRSLKELQIAPSATILVVPSGLKFRLPDGQAQTKQFPPDTSLAEVYTFVETEVVEPTFGKFTLIMNFPRRQLDQEDQTRSLNELQISPSATILVLPIGLHFLLPDGQTRTKQFSPDTSLAKVYTFVKAEVVEPTFGKFTLTTTFPRRQLDQMNQRRSLRELKIGPSATILVLPSGGLGTRGAAGDLMSLLWLLLTPFTIMWAMLNSFFSSPYNQKARRNQGAIQPLQNVW